MAPRQINHYIYWSERLTRELADELRINVRPRWRLGLSSRTPVVGIEVQQQDYSLRMDDIARRIDASGIIHDFNPATKASATPYFVRGVSNDVALVHSTDSMLYGALLDLGLRGDGLNPDTALCLFGSLKNFIGYKRVKDEDDSTMSAPESAQTGGLYSSEAGIVNLMRARSLPLEDDLPPGQIMSGELLRDVTIMSEAKLGIREDSAYRAVRWANSIGRNDDATVLIVSKTSWCAQIYTDVFVKHRKNDPVWLQEISRILIGAPLWVRTSVSGPA